MPSRRIALPAAARPPFAVTAVAGALAALIATGHAPAAARGATDVRPATQASGPAVLAMRATQADQVRVARALGALAPPSADRTGHASRSAHRTPVHQKAPGHQWVRPNSGPLTSPFGYRWGRLHAGIDLAGPYGSPILAATDGCITYAGPESGYGEVLKMTDWDGTETLYGHMSAFVRTSGCVKAGTVIARVGSAGDATGPHLHFEVHVGGAPVNPIPFLAKRGLYV